MKRKNVKFNIGNRPCSVWRITLVNIFANVKDTASCLSIVYKVDTDFEDCLNLATLDVFRTYVVFGVDFPDALNHINYDRDQWQVYRFDRLRYLPYDASYEL